MRILIALALISSASCAQPGHRLQTAKPASSIVDSLTRQVKAAYDLSQPNVQEHLLSPYPPTGRVVSRFGWSESSPRA